MTTCCSRECHTPFCPQCGKAQDNPRAALLSHLRKNKAAYAKRADKANQNVAAARAKNSTTIDIEYFERQASMTTAAAAKYAAWIEVVEQSPSS